MSSQHYAYVDSLSKALIINSVRHHCKGEHMSVTRENGNTIVLLNPPKGVTSYHVDC